MKTTATFSDSQGGKEKNSQEPSIHSEKRHSFANSKKSASAKTKSTTKEIIVFIVDDDLLYLNALEHSILEKLPEVKIKVFQTGEACLQQLKLKPDVIILDYFLDSKVSYAWNGLTILKQIKQINPKTKVIMLSSQDSLDVAVRCIDNGSFDYVSKSESAFVKINNMLMNIIQDINATDKGMKPYQVIGIIVIIILLLCYFLINK
jgi:PleD family two-component response regulator